MSRSRPERPARTESTAVDRAESVSGATDGSEPASGATDGSEPVAERADDTTAGGTTEPSADDAGAVAEPQPSIDADRDEVEAIAHGGTYAALGLGLVGLGLLVGSPALVVAALVPFAFVAAVGGGASGDTRPGPVPDRPVRFTRRVGDPTDGVRVDGSIISGDPGDTVTVRVTAHNVGSGPVVDLRLADGVPAALPVVGGNPRLATRLDPGESATIEYELALRRGSHAFAAPTLRVRPLDGSAQRTWRLTVDDDVTLRCLPTVDDVPLGGGTNDYAGEVPADEGGSGVEFYAVRDYEQGDPMRAVDWRRYARTRELATVEYRAERATEVVCVVDVRGSERRTPAGSSLPAATLSADAAERTVRTLTDAGHPSGVVCLYDRGALLVTPGTDTTTRERIRTLLSAAQDGERPVESIARSRHGSPGEVLAETLSGSSHVYLFSSFVDDGLDGLAERLRAGNHAVRVVSPDVVGDGVDDAARIASIARDNRLARARSTGARVVDWELDRPLALVLREAVGEGRAR